MTAQQHVCIVTSAHPLDDVRVNSKFAQSFLDAGFRVTWVGPERSYFKDESDRDQRITYHLTAPLRTRPDRLRSAPRVVRLARRVPEVDWYYVPDPDAAQAMTRARGLPGRVLFDVHEVFHGALLDRWLLGRPVRPVRELVRRRIAATCAAADLVCGVSRSVLEPYLDPDLAVVVRNSAPRWFADAGEDGGGGGGTAAAAPRTGDAPMTFVHGKTLATNGTPVILEALGLPGASEARVLMFPSAKGSAYLPDLDQRVATSGVAEQLWLHESVTHEQMPALLRRCQVGMIAYGRSLGRDSLPNRLFEYMATGLAILAPSYASEIRRIVEAEDIGRTVDFEDPAAVRDAIEWFVEHPEETARMGERARSSFLERYSWDVEFSRLVAVMDRVAVRSPGRTSMTGGTS